jgi:hypothetical protein
VKKRAGSHRRSVYQSEAGRSKLRREERRREKAKRKRHKRDEAKHKKFQRTIDSLASELGSRVTAACRVKRSFETEAEARHKAAMSRLSLKPYKCVVCGRWHLTSQEAG